MLSKDALGVFQQRLQDARRPLETLTVHDGITAMASFYQDERADDCELDEDGDMLLVQWGPMVARGVPSTFEVNVTRQFIGPQQDAEVVQLSLTFSFPLDPSWGTVERGDRWFETPDLVAELPDLVASLAVFEVVAQRTDAHVTLTFEPT